MNDNKPLGIFGEFTGNQLITFLNQLDLSEYLNNMGIVIHPISLISGVLIYKLVVNTYAKQAYPISTLNFIGDPQAREKWLTTRAWNIRIFMLFYAPIISYGIFYGCNKSILDSVKINYNKDVSNSILSLFFVIKKRKNNHRYMSSSNTPSNNKNNKPNYLKYILIFLLFIITVGVNNIFNILKNITFIKVLFLYIIVGSLYLIYLFIELYIFILFIKNKIKIPYYLPPFLSDWLANIEKDSKFSPEAVRAFMDLRVRNVILHIISLLFLIILYTNL